MGIWFRCALTLDVFNAVKTAELHQGKPLMRRNSIDFLMNAPTKLRIGRSGN